MGAYLYGPGAAPGGSVTYLVPPNEVRRTRPATSKNTTHLVHRTNQTSSSISHAPPATRTSSPSIVSTVPRPPTFLPSVRRRREFAMPVSCWTGVAAAAPRAACLLLLLLLAAPGGSAARQLKGSEDGRWGPALASSPDHHHSHKLTAYSARERGALYDYVSEGDFDGGHHHWEKLGGTAMSKPAAASWEGTDLVAVVGTDQALWYLLSGGDESSSDSDSSDSDDDGSVWRDHDDLSCMDDGGDNYDIYRDIDGMSACKAKCEGHSKCAAVTFSKHGDCYLKKSCDDLEARDNGDDSAVLLSRGHGSGSGHDTSDDGHFSGRGGWASVPSGKCSSAPAVSAVDGRFDLLCRGTDGKPYAHAVVDGRPADGWTSLGGAVKAGTSPAAAGLGGGKTGVVVAGTDSELYWTKSDKHGQDWESWSSALPSPPESMRGSPALTFVDGRVLTFVVGRSGRPYMLELNDDGKVERGWQGLGAANCVSDLAATAQCPYGSSGGDHCATAACYGTDAQLWYTTVQSGSSNGKWTATGLQAP